MESQKLIAIDIESLANSNIATTSTSVISKKTEKKLQLADFKNYSETFRDLLALFDEELCPKMVALMCARLNITEAHKVQIYVHKARNKENFLLNLFSDCQDEIRYFESVIQFLEQFESTKFLVQSLRKEQNSIFKECEKNQKSAFSIQFSLQGNKISFKSQSQSSLTTNSSSDSEKILKTNVLLVFTSNQQKRHQVRIKNFKDKIEKSNIALIDFNLSKKYENTIKNEFLKWENWPVFLLFDKEIDEIIDFNKNGSLRKSPELNNIVELYLQLYLEYLNCGNRRFYVFVLDDYKDYCLHKNGKFRYHWLLKKITDPNGNEKLIPPIRIPDNDKTSSESVYFDKFLEYLKSAIRPFCQSSVL